MKLSEDILNELKEIAPSLAAVERVNHFHVPENYFTTFSKKIAETVTQTEVKQELNALAPQLSKLLSSESAKAPSEYFKNFSAGLLQKIRAEETAAELNTVAPTLAQLQKVNVYSVPKGYFNTFPKTISQQIAAGEPRPESVVPGWLKSINTALDNLAIALFQPKMAYAFAGSVAMIIVAAMMFAGLEQTQPCAKDDLLCRLEKVSTEELNAYFDSHYDEFGKSMLDVSADEVHRFHLNPQNVMKNISDEDLNNVFID
ncbi:MAG: hypothetical protein KIS94_03025 [Chitinophagales bacterium]|nr:hypothetical protein [Chitinophagales bacterium]